MSSCIGPSTRPVLGRELQLVALSLQLPRALASEVFGRASTLDRANEPVRQHIADTRGAMAEFRKALTAGDLGQFLDQSA